MFMVENMKIEIKRKNIILEIKRSISLSRFMKLSNEEKMDYFISRADSYVLDWHCRIIEDKRRRSFTFEMWRELAEKEFGRGTGLYTICNLKQEGTQSVSDFIRDVSNRCLTAGIEASDMRSIIKNGIQKKLEFY
jgi:hypothetical protein